MPNLLVERRSVRGMSMGSVHQSSENFGLLTSCETVDGGSRSPSNGQCECPLCTLRFELIHLVAATWQHLKRGYNQFNLFHMRTECSHCSGGSIGRAPYISRNHHASVIHKSFLEGELAVKRLQEPGPPHPPWPSLRQQQTQVTPCLSKHLFVQSHLKERYVAVRHSPLGAGDRPR